jgi:hypothetical protein
MKPKFNAIVCATVLPMRLDAVLRRAYLSVLLSIFCLPVSASDISSGPQTQ